jgi:diacylglycerol kinase (ATP)
VNRVVVVNLAAAGGRAAGVWERLRGTAGLAGARLVQARDAVAAAHELGALLDQGVERLLVVGGDGTMHMVGNVLLARRDAAQVPVGLIPVGTGSDLARALHVPTDPHAALERALAAAPRPLDVLAVATDDGRQRYVLNVASAGISGVVDTAVNAQPHRGRAAYLRATIGAVRRYRPVPCRIVADGEPWYEGPLFLLAVANGTSFGRGMCIAPQARTDDGLADLVLIGAVPIRQLLLRLPQLYRGTHLGSRHVRWRRAARIRLEAAAPLPPFDLDGDVFPSAAAEFTLLPGALRILA